MRRIAVCPGSFDPITIGHVALIERAAALFDHVYVCTMVNGEKDHGMFSREERLRLMKKALEHIPNVTAECFTGLLADYAKQKGARFLVKGIRNGSDLDDEMLMTEVNRHLESLETVLLPSYKEHMFISSTVARELIRYGRPLGQYVPESLEEEIKSIWQKKA